MNKLKINTKIMTNPEDIFATVQAQLKQQVPEDVAQDLEIAFDSSPLTRTLLMCCDALLNAQEEALVPTLHLVSQTLSPAITLKGLLRGIVDNYLIFYCFQHRFAALSLETQLALLTLLEETFPEDQEAILVLGIWIQSHFVG